MEMMLSYSSSQCLLLLLPTLYDLYDLALILVHFKLTIGNRGGLLMV